MVRSDSGPPRVKRSKEYMQENGIDHHRITPLWPQANLKAKSFMKPAICSIQELTVVYRQAEHRRWHRFCFMAIVWRLPSAISTRWLK